jgi:tRNA 2-thiouridine synthesizing protein B
VAILHTVSRSAYQDAALASCLKVALPGCVVLLIEDGVYAARAGGEIAHVINGAAAPIQVYALHADLLARGITSSELIERVQVVDYDGFVRLACEADQVLAWF